MAEPSHRPENSLRVSVEPLAAGLRLGGARFLLKRLLGRGSYSEVWLAWDRTLEQDVALKFLPLELGADPGTVDLLTAAAQRGAQLVHPAFVRPIEVVRAPEFVAISMEHVDGWSLATLKVDQPENRFRIEDIQLWIQQVCFALDYAHHELVVHGALKPANLLLDNRDELKITDHALARLAQLALAARNHPPGAMAYLSPQQIDGGESTIQDDVYAVGATIYDLLTGTPPFFKGDILVQVRDLVPPMMTDRLRERGIDDAFPVAWEKTVAACLAKDPAKRPQTASELLAGLEPPKTVKSKMSPPHAVSPEPVASPAKSPAPPPANPTTGGSADKVRESKPAMEPNPAPVESGRSVTPVPEEARTELLQAQESATQSAAGVEPARSPASPSPSAVAAGPTIGDASVQSLPGSLPRRRINLAAATAGVVLVAMLATIWLTLHLRHASSEPEVASSGPPGALDASFNVGGGADNEIRSLALQPDGRILVGGRFLNFDGTMLQGLARLGTNGSPERTFAPHTSGAVHAIALQADGKLLIGGDFMNISGQPRRHLARLNADGTLDRSFSTQAALNREVRALLVQPDGKILVGGSFNYVAGQREGGVTRLNSDGTRDSSFHPGAGAKDLVWALALQPDGKILLAGDFTTFDQVPSGHIARLKPDGTVDPSFKAGAGANLAILGLAVQPDGKIVAAGSFMTFDGRKRARIARLLPDGAVDLTFDPGAGPNGGLRSVALQPNGKILIGGVFDRVAGVPRNGLARLNPDGTLDAGFEPLGAADGGLWRVLVQPDGKVLVAGVFKTFNGADCGRIARLLGDPARSEKRT